MKFPGITMVESDLDLHPCALGKFSSLICKTPVSKLIHPRRHIHLELGLRSESMFHRTGSDSRCCKPEGALYSWHWFYQPEHPAIKALEKWFKSLSIFAANHEQGRIERLFDLAAQGRLYDSEDHLSLIKPIHGDPEIFELRHTALNKALRFYHGEPFAYPKYLIALHKHIKIDASLQQGEIDFAVTALESWEHLTPLSQIRDRAKVLTESRIAMLSDLVKLRRARGMTQQDIVQILEISQQAVSKIEGYDSNPTLETLESYANVVGAVLEIVVRAEPGIEKDGHITAAISGGVV